MRCDIVTIFPEVFEPYINTSILSRAQTKGLVSLIIHNLRDFSFNKHHQVDDTPYGGGPGMVLKPEPVFRAVEQINKESIKIKDKRIILSTPQGKPFNQKTAQELSQHEQLIIICGRYEGIDERVAQGLVTDEISIGDYVLTGGELPALVILDAVARLISGVLGDDDSAQADSFSEGLLDYPHYTRPAEYNKMKVPEILLSGHHEKINQWRHYQALKRTYLRRPDLLNNLKLSDDDKILLQNIIG